MKHETHARLSPNRSLLRPANVTLPARCYAPLLVVLLLLLPTTAKGQWIQRLPPVIPPESPFATAYLPLPVKELRPSAPEGELTAYVDPNADLALPQSESGQAPAGPKLPHGAKPGILQRVIFVNSWLSGGEPDDLEMLDSEFRFSLGFPFPTVETPLVVSPGLGAHFLDGPDSPDLPARVYDAYVDFMWKLPLSEQFNLDLAVTPGWYSDLEQSNSDALRIGARAIGSYTWSPQFKFALGLVYLDREDIDFLPVGGVIWTPTPDWKIDAVFPKPRIAWRYGCEGEYSTWWYAAGEFGGGSWAIERLDGTPDLVTYSDWRISIGQEIKRGKDSIAWIELGYVFQRELEYKSGTPDFEPADTIMLRAGVGY